MRELGFKKIQSRHREGGSRGGISYGTTVPPRFSVGWQSHLDPVPGWLDRATLYVIYHVSQWISYRTGVFYHFIRAGQTLSLSPVVSGGEA